MHFSDIPNAALSQDNDRPLMQKEVYPVSAALRHYLEQQGYGMPLPLHYPELMHYDYSKALKDADGRHTHWERVIYKHEVFSRLAPRLLELYRLLTGGAPLPAGMQIMAVDFCEFANSMPFRIHLQAPQQEPVCYYIKNADASRIYGMLLETLLTPNPLRFLCHQHTLVETHIEGQAGDQLLAPGIHACRQPGDAEQKELALAFVRFNESCFARLLGDMRSYNFVVTANSHRNHFQLRAIDFDQQCYEGRLWLYLPQFYKENLGYVQLVTSMLSPEAIEAERIRERSAMAVRAARHPRQLFALLRVMEQDVLSENYKVLSLRKELNAYHHTLRFNLCHSMGALVRMQLKILLQPHLPPEKARNATK